MGSDTDRFGGETRRKIAFLPLAGGTVVPPNIPYGLPNDLYRIDQATSPFTRRAFDGTIARLPNDPRYRRELGDTARGAFALNGQLYTGQSNGTLTCRSFDGTVVGASTPIDLFGLNVAPPRDLPDPGNQHAGPRDSARISRR